MTQVGIKNKRWDIVYTASSHSKLTPDDIISILLKNRGITEEEKELFLHPNLDEVNATNVEINEKQLKKAVKRINTAILKKEKIVIFGDYDVDGICGSAILWETLYGLGADAIPYIPHRLEEGYGLSIKGIDNVLEKYPNLSLIITVDNGIVAFDAVDYAKEKGIDVIITDHHVQGDTLPNAYAIVHTTKLCGTGVGWILSHEFGEKDKDLEKSHLELVALATIADLVQLKGANRTVTKFGIDALHTTQRVGLLALLQEAAISKEGIGVYEIGHIIAPRLNASGRMEYAMQSLRLLCTREKEKAEQLAMNLGKTNKDRQLLTKDTILHAKQMLLMQSTNKKLLFLSHESYQAGIIGLVAGKLVEEYYRPSIVLSIGDTHAKASARSISGFNIIDFIRTAQDFLVDAGGHPMAAGFTVENSKITLLQEFLENKAEEILHDDQLIRSIKIDIEIPLEMVNEELYESLQQLAPFGMGNSEPVFVSKHVILEEQRLIGKEGTHLKIKVSKNNKIYEAIGFGLGDKMSQLEINKPIDIVYTISIDTWNNNKRLQLKLRDIHSSSL